MFRPAALFLSLLMLVVIPDAPAIAQEKAGVPPAAGTEPPQQPASGRFLHEVVVKSPAHAASLRSLLGGKRGLPSWVRNMLSTPRYVSGASRAVAIDGRPMELFGACLAGRCPQSRLRVLFAVDGKVVGLRIEDEALGEVVLGEPSAEALAALMQTGI